MTRPLLGPLHSSAKASRHGHSLRRHHHRLRRGRRHARSTGWRRPASESCCSSAATTCPASPRTGAPARSTSRAATRPRSTGATRRGRIFTRTPTTGSVATPSSTARRCSGSGARTSASSGITAASRPRGRSATRTSSRTTPRPSTSIRCTASAAWIRPSRRRARRTCIPPVSHEPRIQQLSEDFARLGCKPFHVPLGIMLNEADRRRSECIRCATCDGHPCLVQAKSDAQVVCVDPTLDHYPNVTLLDRRVRLAARDRAPRGAR